MFVLRSFALGNWLEHPDCSIDLAGLQCLSLFYEPGYTESCHGAITNILQIAGRSLKELHLRRQTSGNVDMIPWSFKHNPSLESLSLDITPFIMFPTDLFPPQWLLTILTRLPKPSRLN
ncbi:hypothetical protein DXG03_002386 [Asterophora parasitica]|uniref:Uncharacterized protein n=1 Tax=Asterophora parasitica TaxID=117018 RepID=A0A9P7G221_9AGAR|nr:hypothetical protein DXG03_002386 [Asterophora parasitica]